MCNSIPNENCYIWGVISRNWKQVNGWSTNAEEIICKIVIELTNLRYFEELEQISHLYRCYTRRRSHHPCDHFRFASIFAFVLRTPNIANGTWNTKYDYCNLDLLVVRKRSNLLLICFYRPQRKVMFLHLSVILFGGGADSEGGVYLGGGGSSSSEVCLQGGLPPGGGSAESLMYWHLVVASSRYVSYCNVFLLFLLLSFYNHQLSDESWVE